MIISIHSKLKGSSWLFPKLESKSDLKVGIVTSPKIKLVFGSPLQHFISHICRKIEVS